MPWQRHRRLLFHRPAGAVEVVDQGLGHVVAAEPVEVILVAGLVFDLGQAGSARVEHVGRPQPGLLDGDDVADGAVVHALDGLAVGRPEAALQAGEHAQVLLLRQFAGGLHHLDARRVDGVRLLDEDVLARLDRGHHVHGVELGGAGDDHGVARIRSRACSRRSPAKQWSSSTATCAGFRSLSQARLVLTRSGTMSAMATRRTPSSAVMRLQRAFGAAAAAADHADADEVAAGCVGGGSERQCAQERAA